MNHANDPRTPSRHERRLAELRDAIRNELQAALVRGHHVSWGAGYPSELAADCIHGCGLGDEKASRTWVTLHAAIANGECDAEVARLAREHHQRCAALAADDLADCAMDGRRITFPVRGGR